MTIACDAPKSRAPSRASISSKGRAHSRLIAPSPRPIRWGAYVAYGVSWNSTHALPIRAAYCDRSCSARTPERCRVRLNRPQSYVGRVDIGRAASGELAMRMPAIATFSFTLYRHVGSHSRRRRASLSAKTIIFLASWRGGDGSGGACSRHRDFTAD